VLHRLLANWLEWAKRASATNARINIAAIRVAGTQPACDSDYFPKCSLFELNLNVSLLSYL